jgi:hypothetical protein
MDMKVAVLAGANLAVHALTAMATSPSAQATNETLNGFAAGGTPTAVAFNSLSLTAIEKSFIEVPVICKARNAAFDPIVIGQEEVSSDVLAIHSALDNPAGAVA